LIDASAEPVAMTDPVESKAAARQGAL